MKYLKLFDSHSDYERLESSLTRPNVSSCLDERGAHYKTIPLHPEAYFSFVAEEAGTFKLDGNDLVYSIDNGVTWHALEDGNDSPIVEAGQRIIWSATLAGIPNVNVGTFSSTGLFRAEGNVMSIMFGDDFMGKYSLSGFPAVFQNMFSGCTGLTSAENLLLPATAISEHCYDSMFEGCTSLTATPSRLPAETLEDYCYDSMFKGCTSIEFAPALPSSSLAASCYDSMFYGCESLTAAPELPANTLAISCYESMFYGCTSLTSSPDLPAKTLAESCYTDMFNGCSSLNSIVCGAIDISATNCTTNWVSGVSATGTFLKDFKSHSWTTGVNGIPNGWTVEELEPPYDEQYLTIEVITSGTVLWRGYSLQKTISYSTNRGGAWTSIQSTAAGTPINVNAGDKVLFKGENATYSTSKSNYVALGDSGGTATFNVKGNIMSLVHGDDFIGKKTLSATWTFCSLFKGANVTSAKNLILPATGLTEYCYRALFSKAHSLREAPDLPATQLSNGCYWYMFEECALEKAPELNFTTISVSGCGYMFTGCTNLNYVKCLATNITAAGATTSWLGAVSDTGTFVKSSSMGSWTRDINGIPTGWTVYDDFMLHDPVIYCDGEQIIIDCETEGAGIYYRLNQTGSFSVYTGPISIEADTIVEAYSQKNPNTSHTVTEECQYVKHIYTFNGLSIATGPLAYGENGYEIKSSWNYTSYNSVYGKNNGSTYFSFNEMGQLFEHSGFTSSDGNIDNSLAPFEGWRLPTYDELSAIYGTTREGATVNGSANKHYAYIQLDNVQYAGTDTPEGLLLFPDNAIITGAALASMDNITVNSGITEAQLNEYIEQGCAFLPACAGFEEGVGWDPLSGDCKYLSVTEHDTYNGKTRQFPDGYSVTYMFNKSFARYTVRLVKDMTYGGQTPFDASNKSLNAWTFSGNNVTTPYSVNAIDGHSANYAKGNFTFETTVNLKKDEPTYLWFQHADQSADIYIDNTFVETHWGGYNAFFSDVSSNAHSGTNEVRVVLCNTTRETLAPCSGDFNFNATLGNVKLFSSPVLPAMNYGYDGFHITSTVSSDTATVNVMTTIPSGADAVVTITDSDGYRYVEKKPSTGNELVFTTTIQNPHLWSGKRDPHLYDVTLEIFKNGDLYHKYTRPYGLRYYSYVINDTNVLANNDPYTGFLLNGEPYLLRGVCMHNDIVGKANAESQADVEHDFEIINELGCNFIRLAHYPHPKEVYDKCDQLGIIVQTEVPCVNRMQSTLPEDYYTHLEGQYADMVNQHYNHPCIMFWGLSNEAITDDKDFAKAKVEEYTTQIHTLDAERMVGYVVSHSVTNPSTHFNNPNVDWFGSNLYVGWYIDKTTNDPTNQINTRVNNIIVNKSKPLAFSEYGAGGTQHCHSDDFMSTTTTGNNPRHDIEYQMWLHEGHIAAIRNFPQLMFTAQWQLFDIAVASRNEGYTVCLDGLNASTDDSLRRLNNKGLVERDHMTKKDTFYIYKAEWSSEKFVHICGKDYTKTADRVIKCYTNDGTSLSLYVNNTEVETVTATNHIAQFTARTFNSGDVVRVEGEKTNDTFTF